MYHPFIFEEIDPWKEFDIPEFFPQKAIEISDRAKKLLRGRSQYSLQLIFDSFMWMMSDEIYGTWPEMGDVIDGRKPDFPEQVQEMPPNPNNYTSDGAQEIPQLLNLDSNCPITIDRYDLSNQTDFAIIEKHEYFATVALATILYAVSAHTKSDPERFPHFPKSSAEFLFDLIIEAMDVLGYAESLVAQSESRRKIASKAGRSGRIAFRELRSFCLPIYFNDYCECQISVRKAARLIYDRAPAKLLTALPEKTDIEERYRRIAIWIYQERRKRSNQDKSFNM